MRESLAEAFMAGVEAVEPSRLVRNWDGELRPTHVIAIGKAAPAMLKGALERWPELEGIAVTNTGNPHTTHLPAHIEIHETGHPVPDNRGIKAAERVKTLLDSVSGTVLVLLSGGGSSLLPSPRPPLTLDDLADITQKLMEDGCSILELNLVRRHLETLKGGGFLTTEARIVSLIISDVVQGEMWAVASGPTVPGETTMKQARKILEAHNIRMDSRLEKAMAPAKTSNRVENFVLADNRTALEAAAGRMKKLMDRDVFVMPEPLVGEAVEAGRLFANIVRKHGVVAAGGETVVHVRGSGHGGRNQEMALASLSNETCMLFASTDGVDGCTDAAGAFSDRNVLDKARELGLHPEDFLEENDSNGFFTRTTGLFTTGPTGTNVCDLALGFTTSPSR